MNSFNPRQVFIEVVAAVGDDADTSVASCDEGHALSCLKRRMSSALFSLFAGNMVRDINSKVHEKRRHTSVPSRSRLSDKRRKLSGEKKV